MTDRIDCEHGHLARSCELCELRQRAERAEATIVKLRAEVAEMGNVDDLLGKSCDFHAERAERAEDEVARLRAVIDRIESQAVCIGMGEDAEMLARIAEWAHTALGEE